MELRLRDHLAKLFNEKHPSKDVRKNLRAMAKLLKEANRLKTVLSANADHMAQVGCLQGVGEERLLWQAVPQAPVCRLFSSFSFPGGGAIG